MAYAAQHQRCPVFGCDSHLPRARSVVRDESLRAALAVIAPTPQHQWMWMRGDEVRLSPPDDDDAWADPFGQAGSSANPPPKRQRLVAGVHSLTASSAGKRRASGQQGSHAAAAAAKHPRSSNAGVAIKMEPEGLVNGAEEDPDVYEVDLILGERRRGGRAQFLIRWLGCAPPTPRLAHASPRVACYTCDENGARRVTQG